MLESALMAMNLDFAPGVRRRVLYSVAIFLLSFAVRLSLVMIRGDHLKFNRGDESTVALALVRGQGYANPFMVPTGATAHYAPGHPFILAGIYRVFGQGLEGEFAKHVWSCGVTSVQYALLPSAAILLRMPLASGVAAGVVGALLPLKYETETGGEWEAPEAAVLSLVLLVLTISCAGSARMAMWLGFLWGVMFHFAPQFLPVMLGTLAVQVVILRVCSIRHAAAWLAVCGLTVLPWSIRNYRELHGLFFIRDSLGLELMISNRPDAGLTVMDNFPEESRSVHPGTSRRECQRILDLGGEVPYNREKLAQARAWIIANPAKFLDLTWRRFTWFWFNRTGILWKDGIYSLLVLGGFWGVFRLLRVNRRAGLIFVATWVLYPLIYYFIQCSTRYRYPIDWTFLLLASYAVVSRALGGPLHGRPLSGRRSCGEGRPGSLPSG